MPQWMIFTRSAASAALLLAVSLIGCSSDSTTAQASTGSPASPVAVAASSSARGASAFPDAAALAAAASDDDNWILPGKTYANNRYTGLGQITSGNVKTLEKAWTTALADDGEEESAPIVWHGTMYLSTPHESVLALDAKTGKLKWQFPYNPSYVLLFAVNRGVGIADGKVFLATQDCHVIALDATNGRNAWDVNGCPKTPYTSTANAFFSIAAYVYDGKVIVGTGGGDNGSIGHVLAFSTHDGHKVWDWQAIPGPGQPGHETWPGNSWQHGGAPVWSGLAVDPQTRALFVEPGNPGPDLVDTRRKGKDLYTDSVVALDVSGAQPKVRWYYQILQNDTHDADPAMPPTLFDGKVGSTMRHLLAVGDKAGDFVILDRTNGKEVYRMAVDPQLGINTPPTLTGEHACPNHGGGIEWNGGSYDPRSNLFLVPSTEECAVFKLLTTDPQYVPRQPYLGGPLPKRQKATGRLTAVDVATGKVAWTKPFPYPGEGGVLVTKTGLAFTTDVGGDLYAFEAKTGKLLWKRQTGAANVSPISAYSVDGQEYIALMSGRAGNQQTPNLPASTGSFVTAYRIGSGTPIANSAAGQVAVAASAGNANLPPSIGTAPYTAQQVAAGATAYAQSCAVCHGAQLQGVSAPALTGSSFAAAHLNVSQLRSVVTTQMPLTAPGSLTPEQYADIMAFMLSHDCVKASPGNKAFPVSNDPAFKKVVIGGQSCPAKPASHE